MTGLHKHEPAPAPFLIGHLIDMGEALNTACQDLARDCTLPRIDEMLHRIKGAETSLLHLRRALAEQRR